MRIGRGKYNENDDNSRGKMLVGILLMTVLVVAAGVLLITAAEPPADSPPPTQAADTPTPSSIDDDDNISLTGAPVMPSDTPSSIDDDTPPSLPPMVESVKITYASVEKKDFTAKIGEKVALRVRIEPTGIEEEIVWSSTDVKVFEVVPASDGLSATVTGIGKGTAKLIVTCGDQKAECWVRIK
jgi:uncharacterized protein YjdB